MNTQKQRVLIVGAGPSGLSLIRALQSCRQVWENSLQVICVDKQQECGGQWNYFAKEKLDAYGQPIPSTNEYLWTNAPKQCFEYPDYPFSKHFNGTPMPSYLPRNYIRDYFLRRFSQCSITKYIKFCTIAHNIHFDEKRNKFITELQNLQTNKTKVEEFDYVVVASGHYSVPNIPQVQGLGQFQTAGGKLLHSIQVKDYIDYEGDRVLVIGTGLSAEDAVLQCYKYGAKSVTVTYRSRPMPQRIPQSIEQLPILTKVTNKTVTFSNGQTRQFDTIIMCTGYHHNFVFLEESLKLKNSGRLWADDLFMGVVFVRNPKLMYLGMQAQYFSFMMFEIQSHFVKGLILKKSSLPSRQVMLTDNKLHSLQQSQIKTPFDTISFMGQYMKDLMKHANYTGYNIQDVIQLYNQLQRHKQKDILTFRDNVYKSAVTGEMSVMKGVSWLEAGAKFENGEEEDDPEVSGKIFKQIDEEIQVVQYREKVVNV